MKSLNSFHQSGPQRIFILGVFLFLLQIFFSFPQLWVGKFTEFKHTQPGTWTTSLKEAQTGKYVLSGGRPRLITKVYKNDKKIFDNVGSTNETVSQLDVTVPIEVFEHDRVNGSELKFVIEPIGGFSARVFSTPILLSPNIGYLISLGRVFFDVVLGPLISIFFLLVCFLAVGTSSTSSEKSSFHNGKKINIEGLSLVVFGVFSFFYSTSLAYITRFWLDGDVASRFHIFVRCGYFVSTFWMLQSLGQVRKKNWAILSVTTGSIGLISSLILPFEKADKIYTILLMVFPFWSLAQGIVIYRNKMNGFRRSYAYAAFIFSIIQATVLFTRIYEWAGYISPLAVVLVLSIVLWVRFQALHIHQKAQLFLADIGRMDAKACVDIFIFKKLNEVFPAIKWCFNPKTIDTVETIAVSRQGKDTFSLQIYFDGFENEIQGTATSSVTLQDAMLLMTELKPTIKTLSSQYTVRGTLNTSLMKRLSPAFSSVPVRVNIGAVFVDISNYSKVVEVHGIEYIEFVNANYLPKLAKAVETWSSPERIYGDEIYLVVLKDILPENCDLEEGVLRTLDGLHNFVLNEGAKLCEANGFPIIAVKTGATTGYGSLVVDSLQVRTAGDSINRAKRLQSVAGKNQAVVFFSELASVFSSVMGEEKKFIVKKNRITGYLINWNDLNIALNLREVFSRGISSGTRNVAA